MAKRVVLFLMVNLLVIVTLSVLTSVLGIQPYLQKRGIDYAGLAIFALLWGMGGSFISLALSRQMAKWMMGVRLLGTQQLDAHEQWLVQTVYRLSQSAQLPQVPEVGIYDSPEVNAFATGPTRARALVAVSSGLLRQMEPEEIEGVLGHEIAHIANGDMVTMTLLQGVVNAFVIFLSRALAFAISSVFRDDRERGFSRGIYFLVQIVLEIGLMILGSLVVAWFSRHREFRADAGGAGFAGRHKMIRALQRLQATYHIVDRRSSSSLQTMQISGHPSGWARLFSTHPPLEERIRRLHQGS